MARLTAEQTADRLGVKRATVYAYVSRGQLRRRTEPGSRRSWFEAHEVEALARRGRPRRSTRPPALDFVIETELTSIDDAQVRYRGRNALELARTARFEQVAEWLWARQDVDANALAWGSERVPLARVSAAHARDRIRLAVVLAAAADPVGFDPAPAEVIPRTRNLIATLVDAVAEHRAPRRERTVRVDPDEWHGTIARRLWSGLTPQEPTASTTRVLNAALVLLADHELAVSTLAARVAASARADPYSVVLAGLGPLAGPLHGSASRQAHELIASAATNGVGEAVQQWLDVTKRIPGFGHRVYSGADPRAIVLLELLDEAYPGDAVGHIRDQLIIHVRKRFHREVNIDFALAFLTHCARMPADAGESIFTIARVAGWIAHALEEYDEPPLRFRARAQLRR